MKLTVPTLSVHLPRVDGQLLLCGLPSDFLRVPPSVCAPNCH